MPHLQNQLLLSRCPHCHVDRPLLTKVWNYETKTFTGEGTRFWATYQCSRCGGCILCASQQNGGAIVEQYPSAQTMDDEVIPARARSYLDQAISSLHAPAGAVMLAASAVDAMLKSKSY